MKFFQNLEEKGKKSGPFTRFLLKGLGFGLPMAITIWAISFAFNLADSWFGSLTDTLVRLLLPKEWLVGPLSNGHIPGLSFFALVLVFVVFGLLTSWKWGERLLRKIDHIFLIIPGAGAIYRGTRKVSDLIGGSSELPFQRVVIIPFMVPGCFTIAFVTGVTRDRHTGRVYLRVAVPTPPNPLSSIPAIVPEEMAVDAGMTVEEGLQYCMSLGMVGPAQMAFPQAGQMCVCPAPTDGNGGAQTLPPASTTGGDTQ